MTWPLVVAALLGALAPEDLRPFAPPDGPPAARDVDPAPAQISAAPEPAPGPLAPPPVAAPVPDLRVRVYVKDLDHLAELMRKDAQVGAMAESFVQRRKVSSAVGIVGIATSVGLALAAMNAAASDSATNPGAPPSSVSNLMVASGATLLVSSVVALAIAPRSGELLDLVNAWNRAHPTEPVELADTPFIEQAVEPTGGGQRER